MSAYDPYMHPKGERDEHGRFEPFYIPRQIMPQVDEADYPALIEWLASNGVAVTREIFHPAELHQHQRVDRAKVRAMPLAVERKPVWVSRDLYVVDGNHREARHLLDGRLVDAYVIDADYAQALVLLRQFPRAYTFETPQPERN